jgi:monoamine oxidase
VQCSETHNGVHVDVGGAYVGGTQDRILRMADAFGVDTFPVHKSGLNVMEVGVFGAGFDTFCNRLLGLPQLQCWLWFVSY